MNPETTEKLKKQLQAEEKSLVAQLERVGVKNPAVPGDFEPTEPNYGDLLQDTINESTDLDRNVAMEGTLETQLENVRAALGRIEADTYGSCDVCGSPIDEKRLFAMPTTTRCIHCAEK